MSPADRNRQVTTDGSEKDRDQVRHRQLGLRRGAGADDRDVVVARQHEARLLPLRREQGARLLPATGPDGAAEHGRRRGVSQSRRAESGRRPVRLRRGHEEVDAGRRPRRQAVRQRRRRPLRLPRRLVAGRHGAAVPPHEPPAEHHGVRGRAIRRPARCRVVVHEEWPTGWIENSPAMQFLEDGKRFIWESERNGWSNSTSTISAASCSRRSRTHTTFEVAGIVRVDETAGRAVLHGARRRQLHEVAAAPRGPGRQGRRPAHRPGVQPHVGSCGTCRSRRRSGVKLWHLADNGTSSTSTDARHAAGDAARRAANGKVVAELAEERPDEVRRSWA